MSYSPNNSMVIVTTNLTATAGGGNNIVNFGTGVMISPNVVLTCSHLFWDSDIAYHQLGRRSIQVDR